MINGLKCFLEILVIFFLSVVLMMLAVKFMMWFAPLIGLE